MVIRLPVNRGKQFEKVIYDQFSKLGNVFIDRIYDVTNHYKNISTPCDFIVYSYPNILYLECKAVSGNTLNFQSQIRANQWDGLFQRSKIKGAKAGILLWFTDHDTTVYLPIQYLKGLKELGIKSFNFLFLSIDHNNEEFIELSGNKKRIFWEYNLIKFLDDLKGECYA